MVAKLLRVGISVVSGDADLRNRLKERRAGKEKLLFELDHLRDFTRDPYPNISVPEHVEECISRVREQRLTYLSAPDLRTLAKLVIEADQSGRPGLLVEAGTALGGSAIVMAAAKNRNRQMRVFDAFGMIPEPSAKDGEDVHRRYRVIASGKSKGIGGGEYYGYREDLLESVTTSFSDFGVPVTDHNIELVKGLFEDTVRIDEPVAFGHLDGDWYSSTRVCLDRIGKRLEQGGRLVLDDYYAWSGAQAATNDYIDAHPEFRAEYRAKVHLVRI